LFYKCYTISRNGRLNVWECDTKLEGLVRPEDYTEESSEENDDEDKKVEDDFLTNKMKKITNGHDLEGIIDHNDNSDESKKKFYIAYTKKAK
jgi:hypothetical protein